MNFVCFVYNGKGVYLCTVPAAIHIELHFRTVWLIYKYAIRVTNSVCLHLFGILCQEIASRDTTSS